MTHDAPDRDISTEAEYESAVQAMLRTAVENGLDPRGAWECRNGDAYPDVEVLLTELAKER